MISDEKILDDFGKLLIKEVFDNQYKFILNNIQDLSNTEEYKNLFSGMTLIQKKEIENYTKELLKGSLFDFLKIFEENDKYKLIFEDNNNQTDINKISEMLKAEPIIEDGWIDRFSEF